MADDKKTDETKAQDDAAPRKSKKGLAMGGGIASLIAAAYIVAMVALPGETKAPPFGGPYITPLANGEVQVNLKGEQGRRYLVMTLKAEYEGYDEAYVAARVADPIYEAVMLDALIGIGRQKTREDLDDVVGEETFKAEILDVIEPILFPVHVGNAVRATKSDDVSGIGPGLSAERSTMRGGYKSHVLHVDGPKGKISLDDGPLIDMDGTETDLMVPDANGLHVYVDVSRSDPEFVGEVHTGTFGRIRKIHRGKFITQ